MQEQPMLFAAQQTRGPAMDQELTYPQAFEETWRAYPGRGGHTNNKREAFRQWQRRLGIRTAAEMLAGTKRYRAFCDKEKLTNTRHVMQASRFYGRDEHFLAAWEVETPQHAQPRRWTPPRRADEPQAPPGTLSALIQKAMVRRMP